MTALPFTRRVLHWFAAFLAVFTWLTVISGGAVTSRNAGMAVPDWPTSFGYNMFLFPVSKWVGPIFYEHSHRLMASTVGIFLILLVIGLMVIEPRRWVKVLGWCALFSVCLQGVVGGLRVVLNEDQIGIVHGILAQSLLVLISIIAVVTSRAFIEKRWNSGAVPPALRWLALALTLTIFGQLVIAATMRHAHAELSITDFPTAYGRILPVTDAATMEQINAERVAVGMPKTTPSLIWLQMAHRFVALAIFVLVVTLAWRMREVRDGARRLTFLLTGMIFVQICLGAWTIWSNKAADVATAHMALGALSLVVSALLTFRFFVRPAFLRQESLEFSAPARYSRVSVS